MTILLLAFFILLAFIDLRSRRVPNALVLPAMAAALAANFLASPRVGALAILGGAFGFAIFALAAFLRPGTLGGGDVKLAALIGMIFGFPLALFPLLVAVLAGGSVTVVLLAQSKWQTTAGERWTLKSEMPYAPFLCLGAMVALMF
ncbi:MAG: prepilin peptidase [Chloroflexi bacterium]|nr:prepilin peptidase [Chloroflexota bacterium]